METGGRNENPQFGKATPEDLTIVKEKGETFMARLSTYFSLENAGDRHDEKLLKQGLDSLPGVTSVSLSDRGCVAVDYDSTGVRQEQIRQRVQELGYQLKGEE